MGDDRLSCEHPWQPEPPKPLPAATKVLVGSRGICDAKSSKEWSAVAAGSVGLAVSSTFREGIQAKELLTGAGSPSVGKDLYTEPAAMDFPPHVPQVASDMDCGFRAADSDPARAILRVPGPGREPATVNSLASLNSVTHYYPATIRGYDTPSRTALQHPRRLPRKSFRKVLINSAYI